MKYLKFKIFWEINHDQLGVTSDASTLANKRKKVAFVELQSVQDFEKVMRWSDLFLGQGFGKILVNVGNFNDFRTYNDLNQKLSESDDPSISVSVKRERRFSNEDLQQYPNGYNAQQKSRFYNRSPERAPRPLHSNHVPSHVPLSQQQSHSRNLPPIIEPKPASATKKSNPFGSAKPVDILSKQMEIEKKLHDLEINKTTFRTLGHEEEQQQQQQQQEQQAQSLKTEEAKTPVASSSTVNTSTPPARSKQSTPSHHHLKLSQPNSPKKHELKPALKPEIEAWKSLPSNTAHHPTFAEAISPPKNSTQLHSSGPTPVSVNFFQSSKKGKQSENKSNDDIPKRKILLKRKTAEHPKKNGEVSRIVRRDSSNIEKAAEATPVAETAKLLSEEQLKTNESAIEENDEAPKEPKPLVENKRKKSPKSESPKGPPPQEITTNKQPQHKSYEKKSKEKQDTYEDIPLADSTLNRFGQKVFRNATYVKNAPNPAESNMQKTGDAAEVVKKAEESNIPSVDEATVDSSNSTERGTLPGRGRGRGRGRGAGRGRGRGRARGAPSQSRREGTEGLASSRSESPAKKTTENSKPVQEPPVQSKADTQADPATSKKEHDASKPLTSRPYRGRGGHRGGRGRGGANRSTRGKDGLFHNVSLTFNHQKENPTPEPKKSLDN